MNKEYKVILENNNLNFLYKENKINVKVIYRKRKTISIRIIPKDNIEIINNVKIIELLGRDVLNGIKVKNLKTNE